MPNLVLNQIKFLCKNIPKEEWSGILFYTINGSIAYPETFKIELKNILPLDKGSKSFTSYDLDNRLINYMMENPDAQNWKLGHIHSHNTMDVFFSGTDMDELKDNSESHNFYLSLIVNNFMDFKAKIAFRAKTKTSCQITHEDFIALDENGEEYNIGGSSSINKIEEIEKMFVYDCDVLSNVENINVSENFATKVKDIIDTADKKKSSTTYYSGSNSFGYQKTISRGFFEDEYQTELVESGIVPNTEELEEIEAMIIAIIKGSNPPTKKENLDFVITQACIGNNSISGDELKERFSTYLVSMYEKYITNADKNDMERFKFIIEEITDILIEYQISYPFLTQSISFLKSLLNKLNTDGISN